MAVQDIQRLVTLRYLIIYTTNGTTSDASKEYCHRPDPITTLRPRICMDHTTACPCLSCLRLSFPLWILLNVSHLTTLTLLP